MKKIQILNPKQFNEIYKRRWKCDGFIMDLHLISKKQHQWFPIVYFHHNESWKIDISRCPNPTASLKVMRKVTFIYRPLIKKRIRQALMNCNEYWRYFYTQLEIINEV